MRLEDAVRLRGEPRTCPRCDTPFPRQAIMVPVKGGRDKDKTKANSDKGKGKEKGQGKGPEPDPSLHPDLQRQRGEGEGGRPNPHRGVAPGFGPSMGSEAYDGGQAEQG